MAVIRSCKACQQGKYEGQLLELLMVLIIQNHCHQMLLMTCMAQLVVRLLGLRTRLDVSEHAPLALHTQSLSRTSMVWLQHCLQLQGCHVLNGLRGTTQAVLTICREKFLT